MALWLTQCACPWDGDRTYRDLDEEDLSVHVREIGRVRFVHSGGLWSGYALSRREVNGFYLSYRFYTQNLFFLKLISQLREFLPAPCSLRSTSTPGTSHPRSPGPGILPWLRSTRATLPPPAPSAAISPLVRPLRRRLPFCDDPPVPPPVALYTTSARDNEKGPLARRAAAPPPQDGTSPP